jgi:hypothetical protein
VRDRHTIRYCVIQVRWLTIQKSPERNRRIGFSILEGFCIRLTCFFLFLLALATLLTAEAKKLLSLLFREI